MTFSWGIGKLGAGFAHLGSGGGISTPPVAAITLSSSTIPDTTTSGTLVGTLAVVNNVSGTYTYSFLSNPGTLFAIVGSNLNTAAAVTIGVKPITIRASGGVPTPIDQAFAITVTGTAPLNSVLPTISGTPAVGNTLTKATDGTWSGSPTIVFSYMWNRNGTPTGVTTATYPLTAADYTAVMSVTVTGTNSVGSSSATSANTAAVTGDSVPNAFAFTDATNQIASTIVESDIITVAGINVPAIVSVSGGEYKIGAGSYGSVSSTVVVGNTVQVRGTSSPTSLGTTNVTLTIGGVSDTFTITTASSGTAPTNSLAPSITGTAVDTLTLTCNPGTWSGTPTPTLSYQWKKTGEINIGTNSATYLIVTGDVTSTIRCDVTGQNTAGSLTVSSNDLGPVAAADAAPNAFTFTDAGGVGISTLVVSNSITVGGINVPANLSVSGGEYSINLGTFAATPTTVVNTDAVRVRGTSSGTPATPVDVTLTIGGVSDIFTITTGTAPINTVAPVISGSKPFGSLLTVTSDGTWTGTPPITFDYQWKHGGTVLGTGPTYTTLITDVGFNVFCLVVGTNSVGANGGISNNIGVTNNFTAVRISHLQQ